LGVAGNEETAIFKDKINPDDEPRILEVKIVDMDKETDQDRETV
jgi:hypothetical protein